MQEILIGYLNDISGANLHIESKSARWDFENPGCWQRKVCGRCFFPHCEEHLCGKTFFLLLQKPHGVVSFWGILIVFLLVVLGEGLQRSAAVVHRWPPTWLPVSSNWCDIRLYSLRSNQDVQHWLKYEKRGCVWSSALCLFRWHVWPAALLHNTQLLEQLQEMCSSLTWRGNSNLSCYTRSISTTLWII